MKRKTGRICVTLPTDMLENFRILSEETDLSMSRLIYLRLKKREPILIVGDELLNEIKILRETFDKIKRDNYLSPTTLTMLSDRLTFFEKFVDLDSPSIVVHVRRR